MNPKLEETITLDFITSTPTTGAAADADTLPTAEVFEDATDTTVSPLTCVKRTSKTGNYRVAVACTAVNGFEVGKSYNVVASATVGGVAAKAVIGTFQVRGNTSDDVYSRIGAAGAGLTAVVATSVTGNVVGSVASVTDRTGFALTAAEHSAIAADAQTGLTAQGYTTGRAPRLDDLDALVSSRSTYAGGAVAAVTAPVAVGSLDAVMVEAGINLRQAIAEILAGQAGTLSGAGTATVVINGAGTTIPRITATVDAAGNRSAVTLNLPA